MRVDHAEVTMAVFAAGLLAAFVTMYLRAERNARHLRATLAAEFGDPPPVYRWRFVPRGWNAVLSWCSVAVYIAKLVLDTRAGLPGSALLDVTFLVLLAAIMVRREVV